MKIIFDKDGAKNAIAWLLFYVIISIIAILCASYLSTITYSVIAGIVIASFFSVSFFKVTEEKEDKISQNSDNKDKQILKD